MKYNHDPPMFIVIYKLMVLFKKLKNKENENSKNYISYLNVFCTDYTSKL